MFRSAELYCTGIQPGRGLAATPGDSRHAAGSRPGCADQPSADASPRPGQGGNMLPLDRVRMNGRPRRAAGPGVARFLGEEVEWASSSLDRPCSAARCPSSGSAPPPSAGESGALCWPRRPLAGCTSPATAPLAGQPTRLQVAEAMFRERCRSAGETIHRRAENVEGILLMKLRPGAINYAQQFAMDDPYGSDLGGDGYIISFLRRQLPGEYARHAETRLTAASRLPLRRERRPAGRQTLSLYGRHQGGDAHHQHHHGRGRQNHLQDLGLRPRQDASARPGSPLRRHLRRHFDPRGARILDRRQFAARDRPADQRSHGRAHRLHDGSRPGRYGRRPVLGLAANHACPGFGASRHAASAQSRQAQDFAEKVLKPRLER